MTSRTKILIGLAAGLLGLVVIGGVLQAIRTLLWDLSYFLPAWLLTPILLLALALIAGVAVQLGWPWWKSWQQRRQRQQHCENDKDVLILHDR